MRFYINKILLWLKDGTLRTLTFEKDRVNVITGNSDTGKSTILEIIDYCFGGNKSGISSEHIGENVKWYGINFCVNDKSFTIARGEIVATKFSESYYFSGSGFIPKTPSETIDAGKLRGIIEKEFGVNDKVVFPFGGKYIKQNTKISFRYFWMFNTQSGDVVSSSNVYFDKQHQDRYREALPRIFDLATGITTIENLTLSEKIEHLEKEISKLEKKKNEEIAAAERLDEKIFKLVTKAKQYRIIPAESNDIKEDYFKLLEATKNRRLELVEIEKTNKYDELVKERQKTLIQIQKLNSFKEKYKNYKKGLEKEVECLKPVVYLKKYIGNIENEEYQIFLGMLEKNLNDINQSVKNKMPFEMDVASELKALELKQRELDTKISQYPVNRLEEVEDKNRYIVLGEIKSELSRLDNAPEEITNTNELLSKKRRDLEDAESEYIPLEESRTNTIQALNDYVSSYIELCPDVFGTYKNYKAAFDYKYKVLNLRKDKSAECTGHTSSSVDLFRHLCLFMGLHEMISVRQVPYVAPFLIIDQPTRPYFNRKSSVDYRLSKNHTEQKDDWTKVTRIFKLLNQFMDNMIQNNNEMQMIVLEHVSTDAWDNCPYVHLVEEFDGETNALIPVGM